MHRYLPIFLVLFLSINGWSQRTAANTSASVAPQPTPVPAKTTLKARVYYEDTGRPVRRMSVMLLPQTGGGDFSGVTDALGNLEIRNVKAGKYYPLVNAPGVVTPLAYIDMRSPREANPVVGGSDDRSACRGIHPVRTPSKERHRPDGARLAPRAGRRVSR